MTLRLLPPYSNEQTSALQTVEIEAYLLKVATENAKMSRAVDLLRENERLRLECQERGLPIQGERITAALVIAAVADRHSLTVADLKSTSRVRGIAWPRQEAMWELRQTGLWSLPQIGYFLGGRDHTTVIFGIRRHEERRAAASAASLQCRAAAQVAA